MRSFFFLFFFLSGFLVYSQDCKELLVNYRQKSAEMQKPGKGQAYHVKMTVTYKMNEGADIREFSGQVEILITPDYYSYESELFSCYQDAKNSFVVVHPDQSIYWFKGKTKEFEQFTKQNILAFQDSILKYSTVIGCTEKKIGGKKYKAVRMQLDKSLALKSPVTEVVYFFEPDSGNLARVEINYGEGYSMKQQIVHYDLLDMNYKSAYFLEAFAKIFQKNGQLAVRYTNYELLDQRNDD